MSNHIEPSYTGPHQRYTRAHIDGVMVPREVDCVVTCSPDTILIRAIFEDGSDRFTVDAMRTIELVNINTGYVQWRYMARCVWYTVMGTLLYMHFDVLHSIDVGGETGTTPLPGVDNL
jgi:hypothetical protein